VEKGDVFLLATDGVHGQVGAATMAASIRDNGDDLDRAARLIVEEAFRQGSTDNLTLQIVRIDELPPPEAAEAFLDISELPAPPVLDARTVLDGYRILRTVHASSRSHIYLAVDEDSGAQVALKTPSIDLRDDPAYLRRFMMEEWIARRLNNAHVLKPCLQNRRRSALYVVMEFVDGQTLTQWMIDNPAPDLETVRRIVEQVGKGLRAFHRLEMLHQDLRPENIMIDKTGTVKIIDFGSTRVAGVMEAAGPDGEDGILGTVQYTAPEYFVGGGASPQSDAFSLGVITYQMLSGRLPYGSQVAKARTRSAQRKLRYDSVLRGRTLPPWIDEVLRKAVHPDPAKRYADVTEFLHELRTPPSRPGGSAHVPFIERDPMFFWMATSLVLAVTNLFLLALLAQQQ
jgi:serine/threonine protein kinase